MDMGTMWQWIWFFRCLIIFEFKDIVLCYWQDREMPRVVRSQTYRSVGYWEYYQKLSGGSKGVQPVHGNIAMCGVGAPPPQWVWHPLRKILDPPLKLLSKIPSVGFLRLFSNTMEPFLHDTSKFWTESVEKGRVSYNAGLFCYVFY